MKNEKIKKIYKLRGEVLGLEMALKLLEDDIDAVVESLMILRRLEADLEYNIDFLKKPEIISMVVEYKKSIDELKIVKKEISQYISLQNKLDAKMEKKLKSYEYYINELEIAYKELEKEPVILIFKRKEDDK